MNCFRKFLFLWPLAALSIISCNSGCPEWEKGDLDIHFINTGRGECVFYVFPDGTTLLMDTAGSLLKEHKHMPTEPKPSADITSGKVISDYIRHFLPKESEGRLDYVMITHYHGDHMGDWTSDLPEHESGKFRLTSFTEVGAEIPMDKVFFRVTDSLRPSTVTLHGETANIRNAKAFLEWSAAENGTVTETFVPAGCGQITLKHDAETYPGFVFRNIASGGYVWTGEGEESATAIPVKDEMLAAGGEKALPPENILSCVYMISYGDFDYFSGGDIQYKGRSTYPYFDIEEPVSKVISQVEVMKASHHCTSLTNSPELLAVARPDVVMANVWRDVQPNEATVKRILDVSPDCDIFLTNLAPKNEPNMAQFAENICSTSGHYVIKVAPGGAEYSIYRLEDGDQSYKVLESFGPYHSK